VPQAEGAFQLMASRPLAYCAAAGMGFCVNALAYIVIQTSSSLTLKARSLTLCLGHRSGTVSDHRILR